MEAVLARTKLHRPQLLPDLVVRERLLARLNGQPERLFTLVSAPAGYGKSTLVAEWLANNPRAAWLWLESFDNDLGQFLRYVTASIRTVEPNSLQAVWTLLNSEASPQSRTLSNVCLNDLAQLTAPVTLVLDDFHVIQEPAILELLARLLSLPELRLHLVLITRTDPALPLPRLRLRPGFVEIRQSDLRFSNEEAREFMSRANREIVSGDVIHQLNGRVDGWIAGLRLAALSTKRPAELEAYLDLSNGHIHNSISAYFFSEVLERQPPDVQALLLRTAVADQFSPDICAVLGRDVETARSPDEFIAHIQSASLFVISLDHDAGWFRFHPLFRELLLERATEQLGQDTMAQLRTAAGEWFAAHGYVDEALQHFLAGGNELAAATLIENQSRNLLNGVARQRLEWWVRRLPDAFIWQRPRLLLANAWLMYRHFRLNTLDTVLERLAAINADRQTDTAQRLEIAGQVAALRSSTSLLIREDLIESERAVEQALDLLPDSERGARATAMGYGALGLLERGERSRAITELEQALSTPDPSGPATAQIILGLFFTHLSAGDLMAARQVAERASVIAPDASATTWLSGIHAYETNRLDDAEAEFTNTVQFHDSLNFVAACDSWLNLARIAQQREELTLAQSHLDAVRAEALRLRNKALFPAIASVQAQQWLFQGNRQEAREWARSFDPAAAPHWPMLTTTALLEWARLVITLNMRPFISYARRLLQSRLVHFRKRNLFRRAIQYQAQLAVALNALGEEKAAADSLSSAVDWASSVGAVRSVLDAGPSIVYLLSRLETGPGTGAYRDKLLLALSSSTSPLSQTGRASDDINLEALTSREVEILALMKQGKSNQEIANSLVISLGTAKRHAANIYAKLGVHNRRAAVQTAVRSGFLTP